MRADRHGPPVEASTVVVDSRRAGPGALFVALPGERTDGHLFVRDALARGASGALVRRGHGLGDGVGALIEVDDPAVALMDLARDERSRVRAVVTGITGSTGKTCTKDFTAAVLSTGLRVTASHGSYNNEVGLPLTVLSASEETGALVCEMGARGPGHIRLLCDIARPEIGVVTNVGVAHMELFGSAEAIREAKAELPEALPPSGTAVLNGDDPVVRGYAARTPAKPLFFGSGPGADIRSELVSVERETGRASFRLRTPEGSAWVRLPVAGEHMVQDALAAAAVGYSLGLSAEASAAGLGEAAIAPGRMEVFSTDAGFRVIDDSYNANPTSMVGALKAARWMSSGGRCVAALGKMAELGAEERDQHERVGELLARLGFDALVTVGPEARLIAAGAQREGFEPDRIALCQDIAQAANAVRSFAGPGDLVLVKGSRAAALERLVEMLRFPAGVLNGLTA